MYLVSAYKTCVEGNSCVVFLYCDLCENFLHVAKTVQIQGMSRRFLSFSCELFYLGVNFSMATLRDNVISVSHRGCFLNALPVGWDGHFICLTLQCFLQQAITERVKVCYCSGYQQISHLLWVLTGILWLLIILSNSSLIFLYFSSVRGVSA